MDSDLQVEPSCLSYTVCKLHFNSLFKNTQFHCDQDTVSQIKVKTYFAVIHLILAHPTTALIIFIHYLKELFVKMSMPKSVWLMIRELHVPVSHSGVVQCLCKPKYRKRRLWSWKFIFILFSWWKKHCPVVKRLSNYRCIFYNKKEKISMLISPLTNFW